MIAEHPNRPKPPPEALTRSWSLGLDHSVTVRPIRPEDEDLEVEFIRGLSRESLYNRVFGAGIALTREQLERLICIDFSRDMALIATVTLGGRESQIGVARYARLEDERSCEFAIAIADQWQGCGVGSLLLRELVAAARSAGIVQMVGDVLATNTSMLALARRFGFAVLPHPEGATLRRVELALDRAPEFAERRSGAALHPRAGRTQGSDSGAPADCCAAPAARTSGQNPGGNAAGDL